MFYNTLKVLLMWIFVITLCVNYVSFLLSLDTFGENADNADAGFACATSRCFAFGKTCFAVALELLLLDIHECQKKK
jgi:hypothetical protein